MKNREKFIIGITSIAALGLVIFLAGRNKKNRAFLQLERIAEEGYETAADILYPLKGSFKGRFRQLY